jgi:poly(beta-D-mannuronate) lyase
MKNFYLLLVSVCFSVLSIAQNGKKIKVTNITEYNTAVKNAKPGTTITLANGVWKNAELVFEGKGTKENRIFKLQGSNYPIFCIN